MVLVLSLGIKMALSYRAKKLLLWFYEKLGKKKNQSPIVFDLAWIMYEVKRARVFNGVCGALLFLNFLILALAGWLWLQHSQGNFAFFTVSSFFLPFSNIQDVSFRKHGSDRLVCFVFNLGLNLPVLAERCDDYVFVWKTFIFIASKVHMNVSGALWTSVWKRNKTRQKKPSDCPWQENGPTLMNCLFWLGEGPQRSGVIDGQCLLFSGPAVFKSVPCNWAQWQWLFWYISDFLNVLELVAPKKKEAVWATINRLFSRRTIYILV